MSITWTNTTVKLNQLMPWEGNPKTSTAKNAKQLQDSKEELGQFQTVAIGPPNGSGLCPVYDGHQRLSSWLIKYGPNSEIDARQSSQPLTDEERRKVAIYSRQIGAWDWGVLSSWEPAELIEWGFDVDTLGDWRRDVGALGDFLESQAEPPEEGDAEPQINRAEELREEWGVELGQMWRLPSRVDGQFHLLICGDCTDADVVARVMGGERANGCFTSPPYAEQRAEQYGGIKEEDYIAWFGGVQDSISSAVSQNGCFCLNIKPHARGASRSLYVMNLVINLCEAHKWILLDEYCWLRNGIPQRVVKRFKNSFEPVYVFVRQEEFKFRPQNVMHWSDNVPVPLGKGAGDTNAARRQGTGKKAVEGNKESPGMAYPSNVLKFTARDEAIGHPASFPLQLPSFFIKAHSDEGDIWLDPFGGSGTTMIASENLGRQCRMVEISPAYTAVALDRYWRAFGIRAELIH
jgi:site-specific DNA-methyltransferase (adenine-specific)